MYTVEGVETYEGKQIDILWLHIDKYLKFSYCDQIVEKHGS